MPEFHYTVVAASMDPDVDDVFTSDHEYVVGDVVWRGPTNYVVERVEDAGVKHWRADPGTTLVSKRLHCRRVGD